jgi:hypothetical protein
VAYMNQSSTQTPPLVLNAVMNSYYAVVSSSGGGGGASTVTMLPKDKTLKVSNYPLPLSTFAKTDPATNPISTYLSLLCLLGFSCFGGYVLSLSLLLSLLLFLLLLLLLFLLSVCLLNCLPYSTNLTTTTTSKYRYVAAYPVLERRIKCKHLQMVNGVNRGMYWATNFIFDYTLYLIPVGLSVAICAAFQLEPMSYHFNIRAFAVTLVCFGLAIIPLSYALSFAFKGEGVVMTALFMLYIAFGLITGTQLLLPPALNPQLFALN